MIIKPRSDFRWLDADEKCRFSTVEQCITGLNELTRLRLELVAQRRGAVLVGATNEALLLADMLEAIDEGLQVINERLDELAGMSPTTETIH